MSISADKIEAIRERANIIKVIGRFVALKKKGDNYWGACPFHQEKTPSFSVSQEKNFFYCFGCHAGGDVFAFVMRHSGCDFQTALRHLAEEVGVELHPESPEDKQRRAQEAALLHINAEALKFFEQAFKNPEAERARQYTVKRQIPSPLIRQFRIGYGGLKGELIAYLKKQHISLEQAALAGLLTEDGKYSLFDERLIFPISDMHSRIVGFGGRRLIDAANIPKYLNTRDSLLFSKRRLLFGFEHAQDAIRRFRRVILVEGYTDVLACHKARCHEAVATLGTAFSKEHAELCSRLAQEVILLLDADNAGLNGMREATEKLLAAELKASIVVLEKNEDPDSFLNKYGAEAFRLKMTQTKPALEFFIDQAFAETSLSIEDKVSRLSDFSTLFSSFKTKLERDLYLARLADKSGIAFLQIEQHFNAVVKKPKTTETSIVHSVTPITLKEDHFELDMLGKLLLYPELRPRFIELSDFSLSEHMRTVWADLANSNLSVVEIISKYVHDEEWLKRLGGIKPIIEKDGQGVEHAMQTFYGVLNRLKVRHLEAALQEVVQEINSTRIQDENKVDELLRRKRDLTLKCHQLKRAVH